MKKIRAFDLSGQPIDLRGDGSGIIRSDDITAETRHKYGFKCLDTNCDCTYHWRRGGSANQNTVYRSPTFVKNRSSQHIDGCHYDYEEKVRRNKGVAVYENGEFHININFPMGASYGDMNPRAARITAAQRIAAEGGLKAQKSINDMAALLRFITKEFDGLHGDALENVFLNYQGRAYGWNQVFASNLQYGRLFLAATKNDAKAASVITVVRPVMDIKPNARGKARIACQEQRTSVGNIKARIQPVLTIDDPELAAEVSAQKGQTFAVVGRPFVTKAAEQGIGTREWSGRRVSTYFNITGDCQLTRIDQDNWYTPAPAAETPFFPMFTRKKTGGNGLTV